MRGARLLATRNAPPAGPVGTPPAYIGKNGAANATGTSTVVPVPSGTLAGDVVFLSGINWDATVTISGFSAETWTQVSNLGTTKGCYYWARLAAPLSGSLTLTHSNLNSQPSQFMLWAFRGVVGSGQPYRSFVPGEIEAAKKNTTAAITVTDAQSADLVAHFGAAMARNVVNSVDTDRVLTVNGTGRTLDQMAALTTTNPQGSVSGVAYKVADTDSVAFTTSGSTAYWISGSCALIPA